MNNKRRKSSRRWSLKGIAIFSIIIYLLFSAAHLGYKLYQTNLQIEIFEQQKQALIEEQKSFQEQIEQLNDDNHIERLAREELGLIKSGETVVITAVPGQVRPYIPPQPGDEFAD